MFLWCCLFSNSEVVFADALCAKRVTSKVGRLNIAKLSCLLTGKARDAERMFHLYGSDNRDGLLATEELRQGLMGWTCLSLEPRGVDQLVDFIFLYADKAMCFLSGQCDLWG
jgi:hypothetical protein